MVDCTAPNLDEHRSTVFQVLQQIGVSEAKLQDMIEVWNKVINYIHHISFPQEGKDCIFLCNAWCVTACNNLDRLIIMKVTRVYMNLVMMIMAKLTICQEKIV